jgi:Tripartite tricarboxylate transporter TctB family
MKQVHNSQDVLAGLLFAAVGLATLIFSQSYEIGTAARMGPGYFPRALGILLLALGATLTVRGYRSATNAKPQWLVRPLLVVLASVGVFSLVAPRLGVVVAGLLLVLISSTASREFSWKEALASGAVCGLAAAALFVYGLKIPLPIWPVLGTGAQ